MKNLKLSNNILKSIDSSIFSDLLKLQTLDLCENKLTFLLADTFNSLKYLSSLILSGNQIQKIDDNALKGLNQLKFLDLSKNKLTKITRLV